ncbi:MAG: S8 family serine peptidase, partial [Patescibacteria group bacterium]
KNGFIDDVWGWDFSSYDANHDGIFTDAEMEGNNEPRPWVINRQNIDDDIHHGTLVAGIIGAVGDNNISGAGINWKVKLMNLKVLETRGQGGLSPLTRAIYYAVNNGANVINISLVGDVDTDVKKAIKYAYDKGVAVIAAAGNDRVAMNISPVYPVCADAGEKENWVLGVSAIGKDHYLAPFSNTGSSCIDLTAPGVNVSSTMRYAPGYGLDKLYGDNWSGTSFAAPFVSGAAALIKSIQPTWGPKQIYEAILSTVHRTPPNDVKAYEETYGAGLLQINNAVDYALSKKVSTHILSGFLAVNFNTGEIEENKIDDKNNIAVVRQNALVKADDMVKYKDGYATVKTAKKGKSKVTLYDNQWKEVRSFEVKSNGKLRIAVGDIRGDANPEIILAPAYKDKNVMVVFDGNGKEAARFGINVQHEGVNHGLVDTVKG